MIIQYKNIIDKIRKIAGWRENDILNNLKDIAIIRDDKDYKIYLFSSNVNEYGENKCFEYNAITNTITG